MRRELEVINWFASPRSYRLKLDWHYACLAAASVAAVFGLLRQSAALRKMDLGKDPPGAIAHSRSYSIGWRYLCAGMLIVCLMMSLVLSRQVIKLPESEARFAYQLFPHMVWIGCLILTLMASLTRWRPRREERESLPWRSLIYLLVGPLILLLSLPEIGLIHYLVHIATQGIENAQPLVYRRPGEFPEHSAEGYRDFWVSLAASACVFVAAAFLFVANSASRKRSRVKVLGIAGFIATLLLVTYYCIWYYSVEFHRISPYLAVAGVASNWLERTVGFAIALTCITTIAYQSALRDEPSLTVATERDGEVAAAAIHESLACLLLLFVSAAIYLYGIAQLYAHYSPIQSTGIWGVVEIAGYFFRNPATLLMILVGLATLELCWLRWLRRTEIVEWKIGALDPRRFAWNWAALALLAIVGIPTLSSFCFVYWLGPWQLYAP
jgi:hypothetical protein